MGLFFIAASLAFGVYIWTRWRRDVEAARLDGTTEEASDAESDGEGPALEAYTEGPSEEDEDTP